MRRPFSVNNHYMEQANFLDVGGGATREKVAEAFKIILQDADVKGIFVNSFGGIMRCDVIAHGIIEAAGEVDCTLPIVVRMDGSRVEEGKKLLRESGLNVQVGGNVGDAAGKIVAMCTQHADRSTIKEKTMSILLNKNSKILVQGITGRKGRAEDKIRTLQKCGVTVSSSPTKMGEAMIAAMKLKPAKKK